MGNRSKQIQPGAFGSKHFVEYKETSQNKDGSILVESSNVVGIVRPSRGRARKFRMSSKKGWFKPFRLSSSEVIKTIAKPQEKKAGLFNKITSAFQRKGA